ncbi:hypothetical protein ACIRF8_22880 [Streptomyces sp. NPDC102406]|uniref:hypothetical protein n=1 Tax=Streptomyces sp. NPDC102406 TaxID=3366171 RepID=UPI0037F9033F
MNGRETPGPGPGNGTDTPRVPASAAAWGTESAQALETLTSPTGTELVDVEAELLRAPGAWKDNSATAAGTGTDRRLPGSRTPQSTRTPPRRSGVDPVKALMHRHRELCERAVDPLEIAAGLEAHGLTDRAAARFRHKDVFSLAEEMYARVPRDGDHGRSHYGPTDCGHAEHGIGIGTGELGRGEHADRHPSVPATPGIAPCLPPLATGPRRAWAVLALLPGAVCALALAAAHVTSGTARLTVGACGGLAVAVALRTTLRRGPLHTGDGPAARSTLLWVCWLLAYALFGDGLLNAALAGGPDEAWTPATAPLLALAVAVAPAIWCAGLYTSGARRRLATSRGLAEFAASARPLLLGAVTLFTLALATLLGLSGALLDRSADYAGAGTLGVLLLLARLLTAHGRTHAPALVLGAATGIETLAVATVFAARLPGCGVLDTPVEAAVDALGAGVVPGVACGAGALTLLVHATRTLTRASAHAGGDSAPRGAP